MMRYRLCTLLIVLAIGLPVIALVPYFVTGYHDHYTCVLCRASRTDYIYFDHKWGADCTETACTRWYRGNIEPTHKHIWVRGRASALRNLYGQRFGAIDRGPAGRAIWSLAADDQLAIYQHLPQGEGKRIFVSLAASSTANRRDYEIVRSLQDWKDSGFRQSMPRVAQE